MRDMFMGPSNMLRMKEAMLGLLAGDIFGNTPIWTSLRAFKLFYYLISLANLKRSFGALRRRTTNIRPVEPEQMTAS
jgi:hypothetical protein